MLKNVGSICTSGDWPYTVFKCLKMEEHQTFKSKETQLSTKSESYAVLHFPPGVYIPPHLCPYTNDPQEVAWVAHWVIQLWQ